MPSIGAARAIVTARRMDRAIREMFGSETQKDVYKLLNLSNRGGDNAYIITTAVFGTLFTALTAFASFSGNADPMWVVFFGLLTPVLTWRFVRRRNAARKELNELVASNPEYWNGLWETVEPIILEAGNFKDGLPPRRFTQIIH